ncbi:MAG: hypothetical protein K5793_04715 [Nitrosarchaeum sp.]|nr:hypothetical protein [Nitrosarchaeum sp.]MCV0399394.1 hypothetical protein [Nitrosarchaeum sp.]
MNFSNYNCNIEILSSINPSENPAKIEKAILNILPDSNITIDKFSIKAKSKNFHSMEKIYESIHSAKSQKALQRQLEKHMDEDSTWFYLNKQAAFVEKVVLCENAEESPLGPLKIIISSSDINRIIDSLVGTLRN